MPKKTKKQKQQWIEAQPKRRCKGPLEEGKWLRRCGADLNPALAEVPEDGKQHSYECPNCGAPHHATRVPAA